MVFWHKIIVAEEMKEMIKTENRIHRKKRKAY
jgi:hypothetical protein